MDHFRSQQGELYAEDVPLSAVAAAVGTPTYVYARATLERHFRVIDASLAGCAHLVCYAVKANSNLAVLQVLGRLGCGFDIVSGGELARVLAAGLAQVLVRECIRLFQCQTPGDWDSMSILFG